MPGDRYENSLEKLIKKTKLREILIRTVPFLIDAGVCFVADIMVKLPSDSYAQYLHEETVAQLLMEYFSKIAMTTPFPAGRQMNDVLNHLSRAVAKGMVPITN